MKKSLNGYSLVEVMVVLTLFSLLALLATQTLLLSLRGAGKSEAIERVKENLDLAINVMERQIKGAKSIVDTCPKNDTTNINYTSSDGVVTSFSCNQIGTDGYIASGSGRLTNNNISITNCSFTCDSTGASTSVKISLTASDKSALPAAQKASSSLQTTILLRSY